MFVNFTKEQQQLIISDIQQFFLTEREEDLSEFAAERVYEFMKETIAPYIYNAAVKDAQQIVSQQLTYLEEEILTLERPVKNKLF